MMLKSPTLFGIENKGAIFSTDRLYRYHLWRVWDNSLPRIAFIGLNPSTTNEMKPDPTITRVCGFAKSWGYGGVDMFNLFAIVDSNPEVLMTCADPTKENDCHLKTINNFCSAVCFAWGNFKEARERAKIVATMFPNALCLKNNNHKDHIKARNQRESRYKRGKQPTQSQPELYSYKGATQRCRQDHHSPDNDSNTGEENKTH